jgi:hypothetical protein
MEAVAAAVVIGHQLVGQLADKGDAESIHVSLLGYVTNPLRGRRPATGWGTLVQGVRNPAAATRWVRWVALRAKGRWYD